MRKKLHTSYNEVIHKQRNADVQWAKGDMINPTRHQRFANKNNEILFASSKTKQIKDITTSCAIRGSRNGLELLMGI